MKEWKDHEKLPSRVCGLVLLAEGTALAGIQGPPQGSIPPLPSNNQ